MAAVAPAPRTPAPRSALPLRSAAPAGPGTRALTAPARAAVGGPPAIRLSPTVGTATAEALPEPVREIIRAPGSGSPLLSTVRTALEASLQVPLHSVRVHTDLPAARAVDSLGARAFTYGMHVFLGSRERSTDLELMAHEVAHVVQQQGRPVLQTFAGSGSTDAFEQEAHQTSAAVRRGEQATIRERTGGARVQAIWPADEVAGWAEGQAWSLLNEHAPELVPIIRRGPLEWLKEKITAAVDTVFNTLMAPVRAITGIGAALTGHFGNLLTWIRDAAARIARGDCGAIREAAEKIQQVFEGIAAPIIERIKQLAGKVKDFFTGLWDRFGAPVWQFLQRIGGQAWEKIQQLGRWIWEKTSPIRRVLNRAWTWIKNRLGIGEGPEGQDGILQWVQRKAQAVWDQYLKPFIDRYKRPLLIVAGVLIMLSPAGPIIAIGAAVAGLAVGIRWIRQFMSNRQAIVQQRGYLQGVIIPAIMSAVSRVSTFLMEKARFVADKLTQVVSGLNQAIGAVAGSILSFVVGLLQWIIDRFQELVRWATGLLLSLAQWVAGALERLRVFLAPVLNFLQRVAAAVTNVMRLAYELGGRIWNAIPACLRDPFIDFFIPLILRQIAFFRELAASPQAWAQTRGQVMQLIRQIFRDFDLIGAIRTAFRIVVRALRIPVDLAVQVLERAAQAWDLVIAAPMRFIEYALRAILRGVGRFMRNFLSHLWYGVQGWLLNAVEQSGTGIRPPASWDFRGIFGFVLDVLGISLDHVLDLLARRIGRPIVNRIRQAITILTGVWEWVKVAIEEGPAGLWRMVVDRLGNLARSVLEAAVGWVMTRIIAIVSARLTALAASAGLSGVLEAVAAVYQAIQTAIEYARRILEILLTIFHTVVQIAQGVIDPASEMVERGLRMAMPVVIGFLANYAGLGGIGGRIREIILDVRARVDAAILWLIDRALAAGRWLLDRLRAGVQAVMDWWRLRKNFRTPSGERHSLFFAGDRTSARLMVATQEQEYRTYVNSVTVPESDTDKVRAKAAALAALTEIEQLKTRSGDDGSKTPEFERLLDQLAAATITLMGDSTNLPESTPPIYGSPSAGGFATSMTINILSEKGPQGTQADTYGMSGSVWNVLKRRYEKPNSARPFYILGHLLSFHLHGPGNTWSNITPQSTSGNQSFERGEGEAQIKRWVLRETPRKALRYSVSAVYGGRGTDKAGIIQRWQDANDPRIAEKTAILNAEDHVATGLRYEYRVVFENGQFTENGQSVGPRTVTNDIRQEADKYHLK